MKGYKRQLNLHKSNDTLETLPVETPRNLKSFRNMNSQFKYSQMIIEETQMQNQKTRSDPEYKKKCVLFFDDPFAIFWDKLMKILLLYTVYVTPYRVSFVNHDNQI